ncbi:MAG: TonB-dependent receptor [Pseudomonadota bacterium]
MRKQSISLVLLASAGWCLALSAQESAPQAPDPVTANYIEEVLVIGSAEAALRVPGSGSVLDNATLEAFDQIDLGQALANAPGVYVREEDGYGLRPNIGIRGAAAERSQKITLMEDGVLIAPAPYSAPAAYYTPNIAKIEAVEVLKGPSAISHGPHTVGGAVNFLSRRVPQERLAEVDVSGGSHGFYKAQLAYGDQFETVGVLVDGLFYGTDGFKDLDGGGDTGFDRSDVDVKLRWQPDTEREQALTVKLGYSEETSDETYLGLTDADFAADHERRYAASQLARFESEHAKFHLNYGVALNEAWRLNATAYYNKFDRQWNKLDGFVFGPSLLSVLSRPEQFSTEYGILTGAIDSLGTDAQTLDVTNNDRSFESYGTQFTLGYSGRWNDIDLDTRIGLRVHHDEVDRDHQPRSYLMLGGQLVPDGVPRNVKLLNHAETDALAFYLEQTLSWQKLSVTVGLRYENIEGELLDRRSNVLSESDQDVLAPGLGVYWQVTDSLGLLAGVYRGFSPAGPGSNVDNEESVNYEYGFRWQKDQLRLEVVGFFSDYSELIGRCRVNDAGCNPGEEFNGGEVEITGVEISGGVRWPLSNDLAFTTDVVYTFTDSSFESTFLSEFPQWGLVEEDDELPYLPEFSGRVNFGLESPRWSLNAMLKFQEETREEPGAGPVSSGLHTDDFVVLDLAASWFVSDRSTLQLLVYNVADEDAIVSHRPFGARPNRPRSIVGRFKYRF